MNIFEYKTILIPREENPVPILNKEGALQYKYEETWVDMTTRDFEYNQYFKYRVKLTEEYSPFKNATECWQEMMKHQPFGWIQNQNTGIREYITYVDDNCIMTMDEGRSFTFRNMLNKKDITFIDGTSFEIREE